MGGSERVDPRKVISEPPKPPKKYKEEVIAVFEDRGTGIRTQEPTERAEAVTEPDAENEAPPEPDRWPTPGRAVITRESLRGRFL